MRARDWAYLAGLVALVSLAAGFWLLRLPPVGPAPTASPQPTERQLRALQVRADAACMCARRSPGAQDRCWASFEEEIAPFEHSRGGTLCKDASTSEVCFGDATGVTSSACVSTGRAYGACSEAEERRLKAVADVEEAAGCG